jgi:hypothetical protein
MDAVYRGAVLTIVAASGRDPNHGLPGINGTPSRKQYRYMAGASPIGLTAIAALAPEIKGSIWNTRACKQDLVYGLHAR